LIYLQAKAWVDIPRLAYLISGLAKLVGFS